MEKETTIIYLKYLTHLSFIMPITHVQGVLKINFSISLSLFHLIFTKYKICI